MAFTWEAKSFEQTKLTIILYFEYPGRISQDSYERDRIIVKELNPNMFLTHKKPIRSVKNET